MLYLKSKRELDIMRRAGSCVAQVLKAVKAEARAGVTLLELDTLAEKLTLELGAKPAFKGYRGYRHTLCTSVNEQVVHGIPTARELKDGDIVGLDFGLIVEGYFGDSAITVPIGKVPAEAHQLMRATKDALYAGIRASRSGNTVRDVAKAVEGAVRPYGYGIVREFVGHGIGQKLHEDPQVPNYEAGASNIVLKPGLTIAIEPMINVGKPGVRVLSDKWTAVTVDGSLSAHFEHTIAITEGDPEILTDWGGNEYGDWIEPSSGV